MRRWGPQKINNEKHKNRYKVNILSFGKVLGSWGYERNTRKVTETACQKVKQKVWCAKRIKKKT